MATMERKRKQRTSEQSHEQWIDDLTREEIDYDDILVTAVSEQALQSLKSINYQCLYLLDLSLCQLVDTQLCLSDSSLQSQQNLLKSINNKTQLIAQSDESSSPIHPMIHYDLLNRGGDTAEQQQAYTLCHSLSSLCNSIYRLVELSETSKYGYSEPIPPCHELNMNSLQQELHSRVTQFQAERAAGVMTIGRTASREQRMLWEEINQWMNSINEMSVSQWMPVPPPYSETIPPAYESHVPKEEYLPDKKDDLDRVIHAVHRLSTPMNDQRVIMTEQQSNDIATATLAKSIERLCQGRLDNQRCTPKQHLLQDLVHQIQSSASRTFDNQRVYLTPSQKKRIEVASMNDILNKLNKGRHTNQDAPLPKESLNKASDLLVKSMHRPNKHKFRLSSLLRLDKSKTEDDLFNIIQHMYQSKPQYDNQRASFSHPVFA